MLGKATERKGGGGQPHDDVPVQVVVWRAHQWPAVMKVPDPARCPGRCTRCPMPLPDGSSNGFTFVSCLLWQ
ncbi:hypothetical protein SZ55_0325 [Pseudomonas sp. FeS53a]|nr:hypothetical protein SZ55_0325 [Pseudomonas sp. FeS53a]